MTAGTPPKCRASGSRFTSVFWSHRLGPEEYRLMRIVLAFVNLGAAAFFLICAGWQLNDPDAMAWAALYSMAALGGVLVQLNRLPWMAAAWFGGASLVLGLVLAGQVIIENQYYFDEVGREMMGSVLVALYMGVLVLQIRARERANRPTSGS